MRSEPNAVGEKYRHGTSFQYILQREDENLVVQKEIPVGNAVFTSVMYLERETRMTLEMNICHLKPEALLTF
jgi:hypothetical protein